MTKFLPIELKLPRKLEQRIKRQAREAFPKETIGYLLGHDAGTNVEVVDVWTPADIAKHCGTGHIYIQPAWAFDLIEYAFDEGLEILGTWHSHPWQAKDLANYSPSAEPSETDLGYGSNLIQGICLVTEGPSGRLRSRLRFYGPMLGLRHAVT